MAGTVYLDANATTPADPAVIAAMLAAMTELAGNPSSSHAAGRAARQVVEAARREVAGLLGAARADEIVFTSGGSEGNATAIAAALAARPGRREVVTSTVEHPSVAATLARLADRHGLVIRRIAVDGDGRLDADACRAAIGPATALVSLMRANNETGVLTPLADIVPAAKAAGALVHTDAVQAAGRMALDLDAAGIDLATVSAHKVHGPQGVGALYVRRGLAVEPMIAGGGQERGRRAGTENVAGIVGFGVAARLGGERMTTDMRRIKHLRDRLEREIISRLFFARVIGAGAHRLANTACLAFEGADGEMMLSRLDRAGIAASSGSACAAGGMRPSGVLVAMGHAALARSVIRFSLSRLNNDADIDRLLAALPAIAAEARCLTPEMA